MARTNFLPTVKIVTASGEEAIIAVGSERDFPGCTVIEEIPAPSESGGVIPYATPAKNEPSRFSAPSVGNQGPSLPGIDSALRRSSKK